MNKYTAGLFITALSLSMVSTVSATTPAASATTDTTAAAKPEGAKENPFGQLMKLFQNKSAVEACKDKSVGNKCSYEGRNKVAISGSCQPAKYDSATMVCQREDKAPK